MVLTEKRNGAEILAMEERGCSCGRGCKNDVRLRDRDVRVALLHMLQSAHVLESDTLIIDELGLCQHESRVDFAVVNGELVGYEIKSDRDTLKRLPAQTEIYSRVFDRVTLICGQCHLKGAIDMIPHWWGISLAHPQCDSVSIDPIRLPQLNPNVQLDSVVQLMWKNEVASALHGQGLRGLANKRTHELWMLAVAHFDHDQLRHIVRQALKAREHWRSAEPQKSNGDSRRPVSKSLHSPGRTVLQHIGQCTDLPS